MRPGNLTYATEAMPRTNEVFGTRAKLVLSYVERDSVDARFERALNGEHHIVVYGSSKQGKTSLRQKHLPESHCIIVRCGPRLQIEGLYQSVLRQAGARINTIETVTRGKTAGAKASLGFKAMLPWIGGASTKSEVKGELNSQQALTTEFVGHDFGDAQSIAEILEALHFKKWIVLENYHYLPAETQQAIAFDLKTFHEVGIRFLILGIWKEANLLITHNGDLEDRVIEVPVEPWTERDFNHVIARGCQLLNIAIAPEILEQFKNCAYGNIGLLQEFLRIFCEQSGIEQTLDLPGVLDSTRAAADTIQEKLDSQQSSLIKRFQGIAAASRVRANEDSLLLPYYLVRVALNLDVAKLQAGIERSELLALLRKYHHRGDKETIRNSDVTNLLTKLPSYQQKMTPPVFYYDGNSRRVHIVDGRIFFVLANANRAALENEIPIPGQNPPDQLVLEEQSSENADPNDSD